MVKCAACLKKLSPAEVVVNHILRGNFCSKRCSSDSMFSTHKGNIAGLLYLGRTTFEDIKTEYHPPENGVGHYLPESELFFYE